MRTPFGPRKRVKHLDLPGQARELTFSCYQKRPLLEPDRYKVLLSQAIDRAMARRGFRLLGFVYMPDHVHLVVLPTRSDCRVGALLYAIKRPHAYRVKQEMLASGDPRLHGLMIRERPGRQVFRFWQEGGGYDRNLVQEKSLWAAVNYIHANPVRRALCSSPSEWKWSSWHFYNGISPADPDLPTVHGFP